jgi:hypothetical protein
MSQANRTSIICESDLHVQTDLAELRAAGVQILPVKPKLDERTLALIRAICGAYAAELLR